MSKSFWRVRRGWPKRLPVPRIVGALRLVRSRVICNYGRMLRTSLTNEDRDCVRLSWLASYVYGSQTEGIVLLWYFSQRFWWGKAGMWGLTSSDSSPAVQNTGACVPRNSLERIGMSHGGWGSMAGSLIGQAAYSQSNRHIETHTLGVRKINPPSHFRS